MSKYAMLLSILDHIREEAQSTIFTGRYVADTVDPDQINQERARAFIHLYLKVSFGLLDFAEREHFITDGSHDGGIDGYYIEGEQKVIHFLQSKFRTTESNFANKQMALEELLAMDAARILEGHTEDEKGNKYNGKILQLQREVSAIDGIARYKYRVLLLANVQAPSEAKLSQLVGGFPCQVMDYDQCYTKLVFPVVSATYFNASDLLIHLDLSNKNAGSKISYTVETRFGECEITALFVPTLEIAKTFHRYKNSMLRFNPRSYLELQGAKVNQAIRATILQKGRNEFALYNNGITMLSDETNLNERIGQKNKAQLNVKNPQIINGGQTAYTLSRIYEEQPPENVEPLFSGKEVLLKIITLSSQADGAGDEKLRLIEAISEATNLQSTVIGADRYSNESVNLRLQKAMFDRYGLLYERKRGEFEDGLHNGYISRKQVVERNLFFRIFFAANGDLDRAIQKKLFLKLSASNWAVPDEEQLDRFYFAFQCFQLLGPRQTEQELRDREIYAKLFVVTSWYKPKDIPSFTSVAQQALKVFEPEWDRFIAFHEKNRTEFMKVRVDRVTQQAVSRFNKHKWLRSGVFASDVTSYFANHVSPPKFEA